MEKTTTGLFGLAPGVYSVNERKYKIWVLPDNSFTFPNGRTYKRGYLQWEKLANGQRRLGNAFIIFENGTIGSVCDWQEHWDQLEFTKTNGQIKITPN